MHPHDVSLAGRLDAFKAFRVRHPRLEEVDQQISRAIDGHRSYTLLALYGASGVGKSHGLRNEMHFRLKELHRLVQCPRFLLARDQKYR